MKELFSVAKDSTVKELDTFATVNFKQLQRLDNSSKIVKSNPQVLHVKSRKNARYAVNRYSLSAIKQLQRTESKMKLHDCTRQLKIMKDRLKSSVEIQLNCFNEMKSITRKSKSDNNVTYGIVSSVPTNDINNSPFDQDFALLYENLVYKRESAYTRLDHRSKASETYDELGMLFSRYLKYQTELCQRKACPLSRHLKQRYKHSTQHCQRRFNYRRIRPYDQRPACSSGNVCTDTYDELKLMCTSPSKRKNIYQRMSKRRKEFLNQPCSPPVQNLIVTRLL
ncbi:uncharacterized protein LOC116425137 isoform X3 [Nomia melanderi]|uniref:uncharacterized protein LOC116425137 isoform X3 n=1 Tax=Nomia melanderi TaxID=2448451 RepID=UPI00130469B1|nr:uncharacterized protein LOC116425137 isoform X4 [Nomia melanderi]